MEIHAELDSDDEGAGWVALAGDPLAVTTNPTWDVETYLSLMVNRDDE